MKLKGSSEWGGTNKGSISLWRNMVQKKTDLWNLLSIYVNRGDKDVWFFFLISYVDFMLLDYKVIL